MIQGIELLGAVELDTPDTVKGIEQNIIGFVSFLWLQDFCLSRHLLAVSLNHTERKECNYPGGCSECWVGDLGAKRHC